MIAASLAAAIRGTRCSIVFRHHFRRQSRIATRLPSRRNTMVIRGSSGCQIQYTSEAEMDILGGRLFLHDFFSPPLLSSDARSHHELTLWSRTTNSARGSSERVSERGSVYTTGKYLSRRVHTSKGATKKDAVCPTAPTTTEEKGFLLLLPHDDDR